MRILILCTGDSCRSQMAQGFLRSFDSEMTVCSAGMNPSGKLDERAIKVMMEEDIDISNQCPEPIEKYLYKNWDYVVTVCQDGNDACPEFVGEVNQRIHLGFDDPSKFKGTSEEVEAEYRRIRNEIKERFWGFYNDINFNKKKEVAF